MLDLQYLVFQAEVHTEIAMGRTKPERRSSLVPVVVVPNSKSGTATVTCPFVGCSSRVDVYRESRPYSAAYHPCERLIIGTNGDAVAVEFHTFLVHWVLAEG